jgi:uncharacterized protein with NRDE domain
MCLIFIALEVHPDYPMVIAANRDEYYERPSAPAAFWPDAPQLLAGRDLRAGGTWLGVTRSGRIAALTNYRQPEENHPNAPSRGNLVSDFLFSPEAPAAYLQRLSRNAQRYCGFNLLAGRGLDLYHYSNREGKIRRLEPGIHGLSNHLLDTPWPKVEKGKQALRAVLAGGAIDPDEIFNFLLDRAPAPDELLPDTGVGLETERMLAPIFISSPGYGTRSSTVILLHRSGMARFIEKSFPNSAAEPSTVECSFMLEMDRFSEMESTRHC